MDPGRAPLSPRDGKRRRGSTSLEAMPVMPPGHHQPQPQTTLPSIRQLHPYLSPSSSSAIPPEATSYSYASAPYNTHLTNPGDPSLQMSGHQRFTESEAEDLDHPSPPKKKRRRQALSCTECKRRKIKCDRTHPCTPCTRRGEEAGCQWHIVEPVDKYVTKAEFDELKMRYEQLESHVKRFLVPSGTGVVHPYYSIGTVMGDPTPMYGSGSPTNLGFSSAMMPPPQSYPESATHSSQPPGRYSKSDGAPSQSPTRSNMTVPSGISAISSSTPLPAMIQTSSRPRAPSASKQSPSISSAAIKASPLSLSSITSPFQPEPSYGHPKNYHAQTLILGERLRPGPEDPSSHPSLQALVVHQAISALQVIPNHIRNRHRLGQLRSRRPRIHYHPAIHRCRVPMILPIAQFVGQEVQAGRLTEIEA